MKFTLPIAVLLIFGAATVYAQGKEERVAGIVYKLDGTTIMVAPEDRDETVLIHTDARTRFARADGVGGRRDLAVGQRIVVRGTRRRGFLLASEVNLPPLEREAGDAGHQHSSL